MVFLCTFDSQCLFLQMLQPLFLLLNIKVLLSNSLEKKKKSQESTHKPEMFWILCYNGCHGFYSATHNWSNLFIAVIDSRLAFTAVEWKIAIIWKTWSNCSTHYTVDESQQLTTILWYYGCGNITVVTGMAKAAQLFHPALAITILYLFQWCSACSTNLSSLKCKDLPSCPLTYTVHRTDWVSFSHH